MMKKVIILLVISFSISAQNLSVQELNKKLGRGINMGNMFEAPSEAEWGNPYKDDYFEKIAKSGFNHVRIPIRWDVAARTSFNSPFTINQSFLLRIKSVVDKALANNLMVVLNMHHHDEIFVSPEVVKPRFLSQWNQIAAYFKDYNQNVIFEVLNEPHDKLTPELWNVYFADALKEIRKTNPTRVVMIGPAAYNSLTELQNLKFPADNNLILTIHYYNPFNFTHQGAEWVGTSSNAWLGTKWEDLVIERNQVKSEFDNLLIFAKNTKIPIHIGEFGAYSKADMASRVKWTTFLARWFEQQNFSWAYWEFSAGFGIYDPVTATFNVDLVDALIKNQMPEAKVLPTVLLYASDFKNGNDSWALGVQPTSNATISNAANMLKVDVNSTSKDAWHVQLTKLNFNLIYKKKYLVTIKGSADKAVSFTSYIGKASAPYNSYSGYPTINFSTNEKESNYTFTMNDATDPNARISFDLGSNIAKYSFSSILLEEVLDKAVETVLETEKSDIKPKIYPNPVLDFVEIDNISDYKTVVLNDVLGRELQSKYINSSKIKLDLKSYPAGIYFIRLSSETKSFIGRIVKL